MSDALFLAGDIGGTSTRLNIYRRDGLELSVEATARYESDRFSSLEEAIQFFLQDHQCEKNSIQAACIGVPGPVQDGAVQLTNLPWEFSETCLRDFFDNPHIRIVNDLYAVAAAVPRLKDDDFFTLHDGGELHGDRVITVVAPGTGLGHASAVRLANGTWEIFASEAGHLDFAPRDEETLELLRYLQKKFNSRVSYERVLSGPGLVNAYEFVTQKGSDEGIDIDDEDAPAAIAYLGLKDSQSHAAKALDIFARVLGGYAGNCVLYNLSTGGVFLGGGIPPKLVEKLSDGSVQSEFTRQGRLSPIVADAPLRIIMNDNAGMIGAAALAEAELPR